MPLEHPQILVDRVVGPFRVPLGPRPRILGTSELVPLRVGRNWAPSVASAHRQDFRPCRRGARGPDNGCAIERGWACLGRTRAKELFAESTSQGEVDHMPKRAARVRSRVVMPGMAILLCSVSMFAFMTVGGGKASATSASPGYWLEAGD